MNMAFKKLIVVSGLGLSLAAVSDQQIQDDLVVVGSICSGFDCAIGETFGFDTIRLKENNLRIRFIDTSSSSSFPTIDWQITVNDSVNGGLNKFSIEELDAGTVPFTILQSAPNHSIYVTGAGNVGFGTSTPLVELHTQDGNSPALRLHQDGSGGFAEQIWDVSGNESNFFVRDVTNNGALPLRISAGAPNASIHVASDGDVGFETTTPDGLFDIAHPSNSNNHALIVSPLGYLGVNIDNGFLPSALFDIHNLGTSVFNVNASGAVTTVSTVTATGDICTNSTSPSTCLGTAGGTLAALDLGSWTIKENAGTNYLEFAYNNDVQFTVRQDGFIRAQEKVCGKKSDGTEQCHFASSRALKDIKEAVNGTEVLEKLSKLEMTRWRYKSDADQSIEHMGVMSEDFHEAFGLNGNTTDKIAMVDAVGVSMASIQELNKQLKEKDSEIEAIHRELSSLKKVLKELKALMPLN
ncbi:tail fiber domain-containing protein [Litoribacillus peritrichatus]|uniref:Peptidase S74 domain-containing protein n=1 Tax=Litoribacillus peritrichatus TaxID=718191 RepID=A0ABP7N6B2_9GAMM